MYVHSAKKSSSIQEGSPSRERENTDFKPPLPYRYIQPNPEKVMEVYPGRKPGMETRRLLAVSTDNFPATPSTKPVSNV